MKVEEIPSNTVVVMTLELYQEFIQGGCIPKSHHTGKFINIGDKFKLSTIETWAAEGNARYGTKKSIDVMLSENDDVEAYLKYHKKRLNDMEKLREQDRRNGRTGCFRVDGKIVH